MDNVVKLRPYDDFKYTCDMASNEIEVGIILGYNLEGSLVAYTGGLLDGKEPLHKDLLWLVESFKNNLINGVYAEET